MRVLVIILFVVVLVILPSAVTLAALWKIHPNRRRLILSLALAGNLFWLALPLFLTTRLSAATRIARSVLGPPWFTWICFALLYLSALILIALVWAIVARGRTPLTRFAHAPSTVFLLVLAIAAGWGFVQALVPLDVRHVDVAIPSLPKGLSDYRIALLSDLHVGMFTRDSRMETIARAVSAASPDVVVLAGDMIDDDPWFIPKLLRGLANISSTIPIVAVLGNHEIYGDAPAVISGLRGSRVELLVNQGKELRRNGAALWLAGLSDFAAGTARGSAELAPDLDATLKGRPAAALTVLLAHQPKAFELARASSIPLTLAGHTHGGQCGFRALDWTLAGVFLPYDMGLYRRGASQLYVNTGTGYWLVPIRIGLSPEVTIIHLQEGE